MNRFLTALLLLILFSLLLINFIIQFSDDTPISSRGTRTTRIKTVPTLNRHIEFNCSVLADKWIITTNAYPPSKNLASLSEMVHWQLLIVDQIHNSSQWLMELKKIIAHKQDKKRFPYYFLSKAEQDALPFETSRILSEFDATSTRRNIGYLYAIKCGAEIIFETDGQSSYDQLKYFDLKDAQRIDFAYHEGYPSDGNDLTVNPYAFFGHPSIWPRGLPIQTMPNNSFEFRHWQLRNGNENFRPLIQQGLIDLNPDVDAMFRMTRARAAERIRFDKFKPMAVKKGSFSPFNSQNTFYHKDAFWGLLMPHTKSSFIADIWRSFWVQRLLWEIQGQLAFLPPFGKRERDQTDYLQQFSEESEMYAKSMDMINLISKWTSTHGSGIFEMIIDISIKLAYHGFWDNSELEMVNAWVNDLKSIGYSLSRNFTRKAVAGNRSVPKRFKNMAICVTGQAARSKKGVMQFLERLKKHTKDHEFSYDIFAYVGLFRSKKEDVNAIIHNLGATAGVVYYDKVLHPFDKEEDRKKFALYADWLTPQNIFQQLYGTRRCVEIIKSYAEEHGIIYDGIMRQRTDHDFEDPNLNILNFITESTNPSKFQFEKNKLIIPAPQWNFGGYQDRFFFGEFHAMACALSRYDYYQRAAKEKANLHPESYAKWSIDKVCKLTVEQPALNLKEVAVEEEPFMRECDREILNY